MPEHYEQATAAPNEYRTFADRTPSPAERHAFLRARCKQDGHDLYDAGNGQAVCDRCSAVFDITERP